MGRSHYFHLTAFHAPSKNENPSSTTFIFVGPETRDSDHHSSAALSNVQSNPLDNLMTEMVTWAP